MRYALFVPLVLAACVARAGADPFCDTLLGYVVDGPKNAVTTATKTDAAGEHVVPQTALAGARCYVAPYNPTGLDTNPKEQSVECSWRTADEAADSTFDSISQHVASCIAQPLRDRGYSDHVDYAVNASSIRVALDQLLDHQEISISVRPQD
jgi:hypothetical protein